MGVDAVGVSEGELGQGLFPVRGHLSFDEAAFSVALGSAGSSFLFGAVTGSFVFDVADRQPQQFDYSGVVGEVAAVLDDLAQLVVQRLDPYLEPLAGLVP